MKKVFLNVFACIGLLMASMVPAHALVIDHDSYTTDTDSGLDWLDVTETTLMSYINISSELGVDGDFNGWRYATSSELPILISNFYDQADVGIKGSDDYLASKAKSLDPLIKMMGITGTNSGYTSTGRFNEYYIKGFLAGANPEGDPLGGILKYSSIDPETPYSYAIFSDIEPDRRNIDIGSFLVRGTEHVTPEDSIVEVPEPASAMLLVLGLTCLIASRKFKKRT